MVGKIFQSIIKKIRNATPLRVRWVLGPILAYLAYMFNLYIKKNNKSPKVLSIHETVDLILNKNLSIIRFGDGEISLMEDVDLPFQNKNDVLAEKLKVVAKSNFADLLVCIPGIWGRLDGFVDFARHFIRHHLYRYRYIWKDLLSSEQIYGDAYLTRPYLGFKDKTGCRDIFRKIFSIWGSQDVVLIEGEKSRLGVGNNMFENVNSIQRILCPPKDAFLKYELIKNEVLKVSKDKLILLSLGPTAKVLAYDLFLLGYRVIDIGHIDMEYEMFLKQSDKQVKVKYKYFSEIHADNPEDCDDQNYLSQIISVIK